MWAASRPGLPLHDHPNNNKGAIEFPIDAHTMNFAASQQIAFGPVETK